MNKKYEVLTLKELYKQIMSDTDAWQYYENYTKFEFEDLNDVQKCKDFIQSFLKNAEKRSFFTEYKNFDKLDGSRLRHIVSCFFFGAYFYQKNKQMKDAIDNFLRSFPFPHTNKNNENDNFAYTWMLLCLFHDMGYMFEEGKIIVPEIKINLNEKPEYMPSVYSIANIGNYSEYRHCRFDVSDHGISGGQLFYSEICRIRQEKSYSNSSLYWGEEMEKIYELIAWIIMCHNIFFKKVKNKRKITENETKEDPDINCYKKLSLDDFIINEDEYKIDFKTNPLFYFFCLIDTIEPIKTLKRLEYLEKVRISILKYKIKFDFNDLCLPLRKKYESKFDSLHSWLMKEGERSKLDVLKCKLPRK